MELGPLWMGMVLEDLLDNGLAHLDLVDQEDPLDLNLVMAHLDKDLSVQDLMGLLDDLGVHL